MRQGSVFGDPHLALKPVIDLLAVASSFLRLSKQASVLAGLQKLFGGECRKCQCLLHSVLFRSAAIVGTPQQTPTLQHPTLSASAPHPPIPALINTQKLHKQTMKRELQKDNPEA